MNSARKPRAGDHPSFEERLAQLEAIVEQLAGGSLSLEEGVARYREGVELLQLLHQSLRSAELQVEQLTEVLRRGVAETGDQEQEQAGEESGAGDPS